MSWMRKHHRNRFSSEFFESPDITPRVFYVFSEYVFWYNLGFYRI